MTKMPNRDEIEGKAKQATGRIKDKAGEWTDDPELEAEGEAEEVEGELEEDVGRAKRKAGEKVEEIGKRMKR